MKNDRSQDERRITGPRPTGTLSPENGFPETYRTERRATGLLREAPVFLMPVDDGSALRKLDLLGEPIQSGHNDRLQRLPEAAPIEPELFLAGMFSHIADSPRITLCVDGRDLGVAMEGDYKALESAYLAARAEPGEPVLVNLEGRIAPRPSMEPGQQPRNVLVVKRFITLWPDQGCPTQTPGGAAATAR
jgi:copper homeostasis protein (lipoprotein)